MRYLGLIVMMVGLVVMLAFWLTGINRLNNLFLMVSFGLVIAGVGMHVGYQKHLSKY